MFVLEQNGTAKKLMGQTLLNWLTAAADGHGGIQSIQKTKTQGLMDTYTITLADQTTYDITVTNGNGVSSFSKTGTQGLVDTYTMTFNDGKSVTMTVQNGKAISRVELTSTVGLVDTYTIYFNDNTTQTFTVKNGEKGDKGDNAYVHIKWASENPENQPHSMGDVPDNWMGIHTGNTEEAPTDYNQYDWFEVKGEQGNTGAAAAITSQKVEYQASTSGTVYPSGAWYTTVPAVPAGQYLWTRTTLTFNTGSPIVSYSVGRMGIDGTGAVSAVNNVSPDANGNVVLTAKSVGALPTSGGAMSGALNMNGNQINGLNAPTQTAQPATKGYVDGQMKHFADVTVAASSFVAFTDTQLNGAGYGYRAAIGLSGATASMMPIVVLSEEQVESGLFGATADSHLGGVYLYAKRVPDAAVTIPLITLWHSGGPHGITNAGMKQPVVVNPNLLDNWYFVNPVNQRDVSGTISATGYFIDRWILKSGTVALTANGLVLNGEIEQRLEFAVGQDTKATVFTTTGVINAVYNDETKTFTIVATGQTIIAAKLELGDTQTLAHQDANGNWVLNEIPDYGEQLARCQRYFRISTVRINGTTDNYGNIPYSVFFPPMRTVPACSLEATENHGVTSVTVHSRSNDMIFLFGVGAANVSGYWYGRVFQSADL